MGVNDLCTCRTGPMLFNRNDTFIGRSLKKYGEYCWQEFELLAQIVRPGMVVVEAGANIGAHTVGMSQLVGRAGKVLAFEPQRLVFQTLCGNLALNGCLNVYAYQQALGAVESQIAVPAPDPEVASNFGGVALGVADAGETVPLRTLDGYGLPACHLIKADVEGMEAEVLRGGLAMIEKHRPILYLENDRDERSAELLSLVLSLRYAAYWHLPALFNPNNFAADPENVFPGIVSVNVLCTPLETPVNARGFRRIASPSDRWRD